jgi:hypothetical protein
MPDSDEIVRKISTQLNVAVALSLMARFTERLTGDTAKATRLREKAALFVVHAIKLLAAHKIVVEEWMIERGVEPTWRAAK